MKPASILASAALVLAVFPLVSGSDTIFVPGSSAACPKAKYRLTIMNKMGRSVFPFIPSSGLVFSPIVAVSHDPKTSIFTVGGFASEPVRLLAEQGNNEALVAALKKNPLVKSIAVADGPTAFGEKTTLELETNCTCSWISFVSMVNPSPDWIVGLSRFNTYKRFYNHPSAFRFIRNEESASKVYDIGTDMGPVNGSVFTPPDALNLDRPQKPRYNIHPMLLSDEDPGFGNALPVEFSITRILD